MCLEFIDQFEYIGNKLKDIRKKQGITQKELAKMLGYKSNSTIVQIEKGISYITFEQLQKFCKVLNYPFEKFTNEINKIQNKNLYIFTKMCNTILEKPFTLEKDEKEELIKSANDYYFKNKEIIEARIEINELEGKKMLYTLPFNISSESKYILLFCFNNNILSVDYIADCIFPNENFDFSNISDGEIEEYLEKEKVFSTVKKANFSSNENIEKIQKEIVNITTEIDNIDTIEDIRDIAQLKLNKIKK